jgi:hypothetical protein
MMPDWPIEEIPDSDSLFMRIHRFDLDASGRPKPGAFRNSPKGAAGMSVDWDRYATPEKTRRRGRQEPSNYAVISLDAGRVRTVPGQTVEHRPEPDNRAHSEVLGPQGQGSRGSCTLVGDVRDEDPGR